MSQLQQIVLVSLVISAALTIVLFLLAGWKTGYFAARRKLVKLYKLYPNMTAEEQRLFTTPIKDLSPVERRKAKEMLE